MTKIMLSLAALTMAAGLSACGAPEDNTDNTAGPVVSTSEAPRNEAIDTTPTTDDAAPAAGASSFTEDQARGAIEKAGYSSIGALTQNEQGLWMAPATKDGAQVTVSVDYKGVVTPN
ncbi:hypothetical protein [Caulobacter sp. NIBR2454]|uniref:hypothetical protein n=1 Tax=Caulobacter sp. NIBR2454 TaxID=3015996 RepID=UPI0022B66FD4|nr:hypothetical protein [Caulobacter sp. NIBR2454]